jgi:hypothetical protein
MEETDEESKRTREGADRKGFLGEWKDRTMGCTVEGKKRCSGKLAEGAKQYGGQEIERDGE